MKTNVTEYDFTQAFLQSEERKNQFTYSALKALYEHLVDYEESCDTEIDFDMIALCCEYTEYPNVVEAANEYGFCVDPKDTEEEHDEKALEWLQERTTVILFDGVVTLSDGSTLGDRGVIIHQF